MKGKFLVETAEGESQVTYLSGSVVWGQLVPGMEARTDLAVVVIVQIFEADHSRQQKTSARKGDHIVLQISSLAPGIVRPLEGSALEFDEARSVPLKKGFVFTPEVG